MVQWIKYSIGFVGFALLAYNSIYFKKLDEVKAAATKQFDAVAFAQTFLKDKLEPQLKSAIDINELTVLLSSAKDKTFDTYAHATAIGSIRYFLVKGEGTITAIHENDISLQVKQLPLTLAAEFIYGNAVRDASGLFDMGLFTNTMDMNNVSAELNNIIRNKVVNPFKIKVKVGDKVRFTGAIELNQERLNLHNIEVIPIVLND